jgi:ankyrin repeat protein
MFAVVQGHASIVKLLLEAGANPESKDKVRYS